MTELMGTLALVLPALIGAAIWSLLTWFDDVRRDCKRLIMHADIQHRAIMKGDLVYGTYGDYQPVNLESKIETDPAYVTTQEWEVKRQEWLVTSRQPVMPPPHWRGKKWEKSVECKICNQTHVFMVGVWLR